jgi:hypothetical protein
MPKPHRDPESEGAFAWAAVVLMHREIARHGEVRLTKADYDAVDPMQGVQIHRDGDDQIFRHTKPDPGPVS